jgi:hypothetical protein
VALTADTGGLGGSGAVSYQWQISGSADGTYADIPNATNNTYTPVDGDVGKYLKVRVTRAGFSGSVTSPATAAVADANATPPTVTGDETQYTVTFHASGGSPAPEPQNVAAGGTAVDPALAAALPPIADADVGLYRDIMAWYTEAAYITPWDFNAPVTQSLDLYANGTTALVNLSSQSGDNILAKALNYIAAQTLSVAANYTIVLAGNYTLPGIPYEGQANINTANADITLVGKGPAEISLSSNGSLFNITAGELVLGNNITLKGRSANTMILVYVDGSSASLTMKAGAKITGNTGGFGANGGTGGVFIGENSSFTMEGGVISGNSDFSGGGVFVAGAFTMTGGEISGNTASNYGGGTIGGGGVSVVGGAFTMTGGKISGNTASAVSPGVSCGGGVYVRYLYVSEGSSNDGSFTMEGGEISDNSADDGGGVYVGRGAFTITGGEISGNTSNYGGGVFISNEGSFTKTGGGVIYGSDAADSLKNTAGWNSSPGHAVYYFWFKNSSSYFGHSRNTTLNTGDNINTSDTGSGSGWGQ